MQFQNRGYTYTESCESTMWLLPDIVRERGHVRAAACRPKRVKGTRFSKNSKKQSRPSHDIYACTHGKTYNIRICFLEAIQLFF